VNSDYQRGNEQRDPVEIRLKPDGIEIVICPGPDSSIRHESLNAGKVVGCSYRNRRNGGGVKVLELTEGRYTGILKILGAMEVNGSPPPRFSTPGHVNLSGIANQSLKHLESIGSIEQTIPEKPRSRIKGGE